MIVPFDKRAGAPAPELPKVPEQFLLAAMGQAHAEGKFHVFDPRVPREFPDKDEGMMKPPPVYESTNPKGIDPLRKQAPSDRTTPAEHGI